MSERNDRKTGRPPPAEDLAEELLEYARKRSQLIKQLIAERDELVAIAFKVKALGERRAGR